MFRGRIGGGNRENGVDGGDGDLGRAVDGAGEKRGSADEEESEVGAGEIEGDAEIVERRHDVGLVGAAVRGGGDGEIWVEDLVGEGRAEELRWVGERETGD